MEKRIVHASILEMPYLRDDISDTRERRTPRSDHKLNFSVIKSEIIDWPDGQIFGVFTAK